MNHINHVEKVLIEKYKKWDYVDNHGFYIWTTKYGDVIKKEDSNGNLIPAYGFSMESMQDLHAYGIDAEAELIAMLTAEISYAINDDMMKKILEIKNGNV